MKSVINGLEYQLTEFPASVVRVNFLGLFHQDADHLLSWIGKVRDIEITCTDTDLTHSLEDGILQIEPHFQWIPDAR